MNFNKKTATFCLVVVFFILDQLLKFIFNDSNRAVPLLGDLLVLKFSKNYNIALSLSLVSNRIALLLLIGCIILLLIYLLIKNRKDYGVSIWLTCIIIGAISNFIDRLQYGYVIDYIDVKFFSVLNLGDVMITIGSLFLILTLHRNKKQEISS